MKFNESKSSSVTFYVIRFVIQYPGRDIYQQLHQNNNSSGFSLHVGKGH